MTIHIHHRPPIGEIVLARPEKHNAMTTAMVVDIGRAMRQLEADDEIEVVILSGEGDSFCSGGDLRERSVENLNHEAVWEIFATAKDMVESIERSTKVVVASVQGAAHAGGLLLALAADLTIAVESARFRVPELLRGRPDPYIPPRLIARVGQQRAADLMLTAREITAAEAARIGLVARSVPDGELDAEVADVVKAVLRTYRPSRSVWKPLLHDAGRAVDPWAFIPAFMSTETTNRSKNFKETDGGAR